MKNVRDNITYLESLGYLVMTKIELNDIIKKAKLGKNPILNSRGKVIGWTE